MGSYYLERQGEGHGIVIKFDIGEELGGKKKFDSTNRT
jgi:hypothetical protein